MLPVPIGALIQPWHYWFTPELSMTESERSYYYGHPCQGEPLSEIGYGKLFELRISNASDDRQLPAASRPETKSDENSG
jgi:hypothetical protein